MIRQCQRMFKLPHNCTHFICQQSTIQHSPSAETCATAPSARALRPGSGPGPAPAADRLRSARAVRPHWKTSGWKQPDGRLVSASFPSKCPKLAAWAPLKREVWLYNPERFIWYVEQLLFFFFNVFNQKLPFRCTKKFVVKPAVIRFHEASRLWTF